MRARSRARASRRDHTAETDINRGPQRWGVRPSARAIGIACAGAVALFLLAPAPVAAVPAQSSGSVEYEIVVTEDGEIERGTLVWSMDGDRYADLQDAAAADGYDSVALGWAETLAEDEPGLGGASGEDRQVDGGWELHMEFTDVDAGSYAQMNASVADGTVTWERPASDDGLSSDAFDSLTYRVVLPGEVTDSNAAETEGNVATWHLNEEDPGRLYASSEEDGSGDAVPGFGIGATALAVVLATALVAATLASRRR